MHSPLLNQASTTSQPSCQRFVGSKKVVGGKISSSTVGQWHVFIGRLGKDTEEDDIKDILVDSGISVTSIYNLKASQPWQEKSAAFRVAVSLKSRDSVMNSLLWPDNVEVRDWFFKPK